MNGEVWLQIQDTERNPLGYVRLDDRGYPRLDVIRALISDRIRYPFHFLMTPETQTSEFPVIAIEQEPSLFAHRFLPAIGIISTDMATAILDQMNHDHESSMLKNHPQSAVVRVPYSSTQSQFPGANEAHSLEVERLRSALLNRRKVPSQVNGNEMDVECERKEQSPDPVIVKEEDPYAELSLRIEVPLPKPLSVLDTRGLRADLLPPPIKLSDGDECSKLSCAVCTRPFTKIRGLRQHVYKVHRVESASALQIKKQKLPKAPRISSDSSDRRASSADSRRSSEEGSGVRNRNKQRRFGCDICGKAFYQSSDLRRHYRVHSRVKPFVCICDRRFTQRGSLYRHISVCHPNLDSNELRSEIERKRKELGFGLKSRKRGRKRKEVMDDLARKDIAEVRRIIAEKRRPSDMDHSSPDLTDLPPLI